LFNKEPYLNQAVVLRGSDKHTAWVNNVMLRRASIDGAFVKSLSLVEKKYFGVNKFSEPNGLISESGFRKIESALPSSPIKPIQAAEAGVKYLNSLGITAWLDPSAGNVSEGLNNHILAIYKELASQKKLTAHVATVVVASGNSDGPAQVEIVKKLQNQFKSVSNVSILGFKIFADGVLEYPTQTAAVSSPYANSNQLGSLMFEPQKFKNFVVLADREKLLVHIHAIGDRAVTESLDAFAYARRANGNLTIPHSITHLQVVKPEDFARFSELNVLASMQLLWASADSYTIDLVKPYLDPQLFAHQYPAMSLFNAGCSVAGASDWPVSSANPFAAIHMAETRKGQKGVLDAKEIMPRIEMLKAYTIRAAKVLMQEKNIGSIEPGKKADFVLLDRDVLTVSSEDVKETNVLWTMFAGEIVYKK
jgi:predicted amidohydrolase YtcJ